MSGKGNKIEEEEEETKVVHHWSHKHRLTLGEPCIGEGCDGCGRLFNGGEKVYECRCWPDGITLDEECLGMPRKIRHAMHPQHILTQHVFSFNRTLTGKLCAICESSLINRRSFYTKTEGGIFYKCTRAKCRLWMHMRCAQGSDMMYDAYEKHRTIDHRSHPNHGLKLVRRSCRFKCDACGITRGVKSYMCCIANCHYWIHQSCASLPQIIDRDYVVHLECASNATRRNEKGIMEFPISDVGREELIGGLVKREGGAISIPHHDEDYKFHNHKLRLVSSSPEEEENSSDDDDEKDDQESELICDGCITPIFNRKQRPSSSSSSSSSSSKDMSCSSGCNYNLHMACFRLPSRLPSIPLHHQSGHHLILKSLLATIYQQHPLHYEPGWGQIYCHAMCGEDFTYNNMYYACGSCEFIVHVGCAMLAASISSRRWDKHHPLLLTYHQGESIYCDARESICVCLYFCGKEMLSDGNMRAVQ